MLGGTVAFSFKGEANPIEKTATVNGTYGPLYLFEKNFKNVPFFILVATPLFPETTFSSISSR